MRGTTENHLVTDDDPGFREGAVVLTEMQGIGFELERKCRKIIHDKWHAGFLAQRNDLLPKLKNRRHLPSFGSKLEQVDTSLQEITSDRLCSFGSDVAHVEDAIEARLVERSSEITHDS